MCPGISEKQDARRLQDLSAGLNLTLPLCRAVCAVCCPRHMKGGKSEDVCSKKERKKNQVVTE